MTAPDPLVPEEVDLRDFQFMPLDVLRLRDSELAANPDAEAFRCAVMSWCVSWHQVPAASLPDDDTTLARLLGFGRDVKGWKKARAAGGLHGWQKCSDGRLYHPVVSEKALEAWEMKLERQAKDENERERKRREREDRSRMFDLLREAGQVPHWNIKTSDLRVLVTNLSRGHDEPVTRTGDVQDCDLSRLRQGQGQGQGYIKSKSFPPVVLRKTPATRPTTTLPCRVSRTCPPGCLDRSGASSTGTALSSANP